MDPWWSLGRSQWIQDLESVTTLSDGVWRLMLTIVLVRMIILVILLALPDFYKNVGKSIEFGSNIFLNSFIAYAVQFCHKPNIICYYLYYNH